MKKASLFLVMIFAIIFSLTWIKNIECSVNGKKEYQVYENKKLGFTLQIPKSWSGYYIIDENAKDYIKVNFVGKSITSKNSIPGSKNVDGLNMFFIGNEKSIKDDFIDGVKKIGVSHKMSFYYFTGTDFPIAALYDAYYNSDITDKKEKTLVYNDYLKANEMQKDIDNILKTFKAK